MQKEEDVVCVYVEERNVVRVMISSVPEPETTQLKKDHGHSIPPRLV